MGPIPAIGATKNLGLQEMVNMCLPSNRGLLSQHWICGGYFTAGPDLIRALGDELAN